MDETELQQNYYYACFKYAYDNSNNTIPEDSFVMLQNNSDGKGTYIASWNHSSVQPTPEQLITYTVDQVRTIYNVNKTVPSHLCSCAFHQMTMAERNLIPSNVLNTGDSFYNTDINKIQVYVNGHWKTLLFSEDVVIN
jgi:hypothetical protein